MTLTAHFSNRIETLCDMALATLAEPQAEPLATDYVLVDNTVMGQWFSLQRAQQQGIAANMRAIQPHELFWMLARAIVSAEIPKETPLSKLEMTWKLYYLLGDKKILQQEAMQAVQSYLQGEGSYALKRYQLSAAVADLFDQYLIYRPTMMLRWENEKPATAGNAHEAWQKILWQNIVGKQQHRAAIEQKLLATLDQPSNETLKRAIPFQRLTVFGVTSMPPHLLDMLMLLGKHISVNLFVMNPCREYWFDIQSEKILAKNVKKRTLHDGVIGNPLLASQGQQVKEFIESLYARHDQFSFLETEHYIETDKQTLLHCIQQEILDLQYQGGMAHRSALPLAAHKQPLPETDSGSRIHSVRSVQIHSCHSALREVEVLHDQLLAMFKQDATLKPRDVVVMMPQVAPYVPYIDTVFGATAHALPYHIADRSWLEEVPLLSSLDVLLNLPNSRFSLSDILTLLEVPAIQVRFNLDRAGFETLKVWLCESGARWGLDAAHRQQEDLPSYSNFSWEFAINRLLSGYSMRANSDAPLSLGNESLAVIPLDEVEGGNAELLNSFLQFWDALLALRKTLSLPAGGAEWETRIQAMLDAFFVPKTDEEQLAWRAIRREVYALKKAQFWCDEAIDISVVRAVLQPALQAPAQSGHPWREGIKFCSLMPMRGVPFRVVYILGMNQSDYPKRSTQSSFDLMRNDYKAGDRSRRVDDRWLFLEALLSARDIFHISYIGRDQRKNEIRQPSVVLAELQDYLRHGYCLPQTEDPDGKQLLQFLTWEHALQPFNPAYFQGHQAQLPQSFNQHAFSIASSKRSDTSPEAANNSWRKTEGSAVGTTEVSLDSFVRFFTEPAQWFFRDRCNKVSLRIEDESVSDHETFALTNGLEMWQVKEALRQLADHHPPENNNAPEQRVMNLLDVLKHLWVAEGKWPLGTGGEVLYDKLASEIDIAWLDARLQLHGKPITHAGKCSFSTKRGTVLLHGDLTCLGETYFFHTASKSSDKYALKLAIQAAFAALSIPAVKQIKAVFWDKSHCISTDATTTKTHTAFLQELSALYLQYCKDGLPFLPSVSLNYKAEHKKEKLERWESLVNNAWDDSFNNSGIVHDVQERSYYMTPQRLLNEDFLSVAEKVTTALQQWQESKVEVQA